MKRIEVSAGVIERPDGGYLLGRRAADTYYGGYWEFPGGKIEAGESAHAALLRELHEELDIRVERADPWLRCEHRYEHAHVVLNFFRVRAWSGALHARVHTALAWQLPGQENVAPMLPANGPVQAALSFPTHYAITHASEIGVAAQLAQLAQALAGGLRLVYLRESALADAARHDFYRRALTLCHAHCARALIQDDVALAQALGADGVHLSARALAAWAADDIRPPLALLAASCHDATELARAAALKADFALLGPVLPTATHPGAPSLGWAGFARQCAVPPLLTFALGGLAAADLDRANAHGAHGIAGIRAFWPTSP